MTSSFFLSAPDKTDPMKLKQDIPIIHPFILAIYPLVFLYALNIGDVSLRNVIKAGLASVLIASLSFAVLGLLTRRWEKAALVVSGSLLLFFFYGQIHEYLFIEHKISIGRHRYLLPLWGAAFAGLLVFVWRLPAWMRSLTRLLNLVSAFLLIGSIATLAIHTRNYAKAEANYQGDDLPNLAGQMKPATGKQSDPDIYYIILDGYARQDVLAGMYEYPDNDLETYLAGKGFYIARQSRANYAHTFLSLASSLNMSHLLALRDTPGTESNIKKIPYQMIENNAVVRYLKDRGYKYVHYNSGYEPTQDNRLADVTVACFPNGMNRVMPLLMKTTLLSAIESRFPYHWFYSNRKEAEKKLRLFASVGTALDTNGPKFVFMHVLLPHPPFLFRQDGTTYDDRFQLTIDYWGNRKKYREQLIFLNQRVKAMIGQILAKSASTPIIIIQGDHGPASAVNFDQPSSQGIHERMAIFNAYLLPDDGQQDLYESITPVNTFRVIFNHYFQAGLKPEPDTSWFSSWVLPYKFTDVTEVMSDQQQSLNHEAAALELPVHP